MAGIPRLRVAEFDRERMKALALSNGQPGFGAVKGVTDNRMARHCELRAYLVRHTGEDCYFEKR